MKQHSLLCSLALSLGIALSAPAASSFASGPIAALELSIDSLFESAAQPVGEARQRTLLVAARTKIAGLQTRQSFYFDGELVDQIDRAEVPLNTQSEPLRTTIIANTTLDAPFFASDGYYAERLEVTGRRQDGTSVQAVRSFYYKVEGGNATEISVREYSRARRVEVMVPSRDGSMRRAFSASLAPGSETKAPAVIPAAMMAHPNEN